MSAWRPPVQYVGGEVQKQDCILLSERNGALCVALAARYPGVRFNRVEVCVCDDRELARDLERDSVRVYFNISAPEETLRAHGLDKPTYLSSKARTKRGAVRFNWAEYADGLDRIASFAVLPLLERLGERRGTL